MFGPRLHAEIEPGQRQGGADVRERLGKLPVLDVTPVHMAMKGVLTGDVADAAQLGFESDPYPRMDPQLTLDELTYRPDGRLTVSPRNTYTVRIAPGVQFTPSETALVIGLTIQRSSRRLRPCSKTTLRRRRSRHPTRTRPVTFPEIAR
jgi:hypothetical protein